MCVKRAFDTFCEEFAFASGKTSDIFIVTSCGLHRRLRRSVIIVRAFASILIATLDVFIVDEQE
jgi:hypothetical protein